MNNIRQEEKNLISKMKAIWSTLKSVDMDFNPVSILKTINEKFINYHINLQILIIALAIIRTGDGDFNVDLCNKLIDEVYPPMSDDQKRDTRCGVHSYYKRLISQFVMN